MTVGCRLRSALLRCADGRLAIVICVAVLSAVCGLARAASLDQIAEFPTDGFPQGLVSGPDGNLWFHAGLMIDRITPAGQISKFGDPPLDVGSSNIVTGPDGNLWFTLWAEGAVARITPAGKITEFSVRQAVPGSTPKLGVPLPPGNPAPGGEIVVGPDGNLWFADSGGAIGRITPSGQITEFSSGLNPFSSPIRMAVGSDGNLWFIDGGRTAAIGRITPSGQITEFSAGLNVGDLGDIVRGSDGSMWFTAACCTPNGASAVGRITSLGQITEFPTTGLPVKLTLGPDGNIWFTAQANDVWGSAIGRITPSGQITEFTTGLNDGSYPSDIAAEPDGDLWFTDQGLTPALGRITPSGQISEFRASGQAVLQIDSQPVEIVAGPDGNVWFTAGLSFGASAIGRLPLAASPRAPVSGPRGFGVSRATVDTNGTTSLMLKAPGAGDVDVFESAWLNNLAPAHTHAGATASTALLQPATARFVFARSRTRLTQRGTAQIRVYPDARGEELVLHHRYPVTLRLWVTYTPASGRRLTIGYYGLHLDRVCPAETVNRPGRLRAVCSSRAGLTRSARKRTHRATDGMIEQQ